MATKKATITFSCPDVEGVNITFNGEINEETNELTYTIDPPTGEVTEDMRLTIFLLETLINTINPDHAQEVGDGAMPEAGEPDDEGVILS